LGVDTLIEKMAELIRETKRQIENRLESITASLHELSFATKEELERVGKEITLLEKDLNLLEEEKNKLQERLNIASHRDRLQGEFAEEFKGKACQTLPSEGAVPRTVGKIPPRMGKTG
jgi:exonuclease SbcC